MHDDSLKEKSKFKIAALCLSTALCVSLFIFIGFYLFKRGPFVENAVHHTQNRDTHIKEEYDRLKRLIDEKPGDYSAHLDLISCAERMKDFASVRIFYEKRLRQYPEETTFHFGLGRALFSEGSIEEARSYFETGLKKCQISKNHEGKAYLLYGLTLLTRYTSDLEAGLAYAEKALNLFRALSDLKGEMLTLIEIGLIKEYGGDKEKALKYLEEALILARNIKDKEKVGRCLNYLGFFSGMIEENPKSMNQVMKALNLSRECGDVRGEAAALRNLCLLYFHGTEEKETEEIYRLCNQAVRKAKSVKAYQETAEALQFLGMLAWLEDDLEKGKIFLEESIEIRSSVKELRGLSDCLMNLGVIYDDLNKSVKAFEMYKRSSEIVRTIKDKTGLAYLYNNIGILYENWGELDPAFRYYSLAITQARAVGDEDTAEYYNNLGLLLCKMQRLDEGREKIKVALKAYQEKGDSESVEDARISLGISYLTSKDYQKALQIFSQGLNQNKIIKYRRGEAKCLHGMACAYFKLEHYQESISCFLKSIDLNKQINNHMDILGCRSGLAYALCKAESYVDSERYGLPALKEGNELGYQEIITEAAHVLGLTYQKMGKDDLAHLYFRKAVETVEKTLKRINYAEVKMGFMESRTQVYRDFISFLYQLYIQNRQEKFGEEAFVWAETARARAFLALLAEGRAGIRNKIPKKYLTEEREILNRIEKIQSQELRRDDLTEKQRMKLKEELRKAEQALFELQFKLSQVMPEYGELIYPEPCELEEAMANLVRKDQILLVYSLGEEHSYLWGITGKYWRLFQISGKDRIISLVRQYLSILSHPKPSRPNLKAGFELFEILVKPCEEMLAQVKEIIIVPDGALSMLPFETLVKDEFTGANNKKPDFLINDFSFSYVSSLSSYKMILAGSNQRRWPVFYPDKRARWRRSGRSPSPRPPGRDGRACSAFARSTFHYGGRQLPRFQGPRLPAAGFPPSSVHGHGDRHSLFPHPDHEAARPWPIFLHLPPVSRRSPRERLQRPGSA